MTVTSAQNSTARIDLFTDLSVTASGMSVTCLSEQYEDRANDVVLDDYATRPDLYLDEHVSDDGTVVVPVRAANVQTRKIGQAYVRPSETFRCDAVTRTLSGAIVKRRRTFIGNDAVIEGVNVIKGKGGTDYVRCGTRSVQTWTTAGESVNAVCRCGAARFSYPDTDAGKMNLAKMILLHLAIHAQADANA